MSDTQTIWLVWSKNDADDFVWAVEQAFESPDAADAYIKTERTHGSGLWKYRKEPCTLIKS